MALKLSSQHLTYPKILTSSTNVIKGVTNTPKGVTLLTNRYALHETKEYHSPVIDVMVDGVQERESHVHCVHETADETEHADEEGHHGFTKLVPGGVVW